MTQVGNAATTPFATYGADLARKGEALTSAGNGTMKWAVKYRTWPVRLGLGLQWEQRWLMRLHGCRVDRHVSVLVSVSHRGRRRIFPDWTVRGEYWK